MKLRKLSKPARLILSIISAIIVAVTGLEITGILYYEDVLEVLRDVDHRLEYNGVDVNSDGIRSEREAGDFTNDDLSIVFIGDSYTYGVFSPPELAIPQRIETMAMVRYPDLPVKTANFGWTSSSPILQLRQLREIGEKYKPDVIVHLFDMTDFRDDVAYQRALARDNLYFKVFKVLPMTCLVVRWAVKKIGGTSFTDRLFEFLFGYPSRYYFAMHQPLEESIGWFEYVQSSIDSIYAYSRDTLSARYILIILPRHFQYSRRESLASWDWREFQRMGPYVHEPFRYFDQLKEERDYPIYTNLLQVFMETDLYPTCFDDDSHWNANGNLVAAEAIFDILEQEHVFSGTLITP